MATKPGTGMGAALSSFLTDKISSVAVFNASMLILLAALTILTFAVGSYYSHIAVTVVICPAGIAMGWACGMLMSPNDDEKKKFSVVTKGILAFFSGYAVAKVDTLFTEYHQVAGFIPHLGIFAAFFVLTTMLVLVNRTY